VVVEVVVKLFSVFKIKNMFKMQIKKDKSELIKQLN